MSSSSDSAVAPVTVYDSSGRDRISLGAWKVMFRELWGSRELTSRLISRNLSGQFRQSFLGYLWIVLPPIALTVVFSLLRKAQIVNVPMEGHTMPYVLFALIGTTIWGLFTQTTIMATTSIANAGSLVSKIYFPREVLVMSAVGNSLVNVLIRLAVVALTFVLVQYLPHWQAIFAPLTLIPLVALSMGMGLLFAPINTMMNDMSRMLEFVFQFGMFLAPTVYPTPVLDMNGSTWQQALFWLHSINPVSHFIYAFDSLIENGAYVPTFGFIISTLISFLTLAIGWRFFHICEPLLAERL